MIGMKPDYSRNINPNVKRALEEARLNGLRIRVHYGDVKTGRDWGDVYDVTGTVSRSMGRDGHCIPLLMHNVRSIGSPGILDDCIVRIRCANRRHGGDLYRHPKYMPPPRSHHPLDWERHFA